MSVSGNQTFSKVIVRIAISTVAIGLIAMILAVAILNGFKQEVTSKQRGFFGDVTIQKLGSAGSLENIPFPHDAQHAESVAALAGVERVNYFATKPGIIKVNEEVEGIVLKGIDSSYDQTFLEEILVEGNTLNFQDSSENLGQLLISQHTAQRLRLSVGDDFIMYFVQEPIRRRKFTIAGIFNSSSEELDKTYAIGSLALIQRLNDWSAQEIGGYEVHVTSFEGIFQTTEAIQDQLPLDLQARNIREQFPEIFQWLDMLDANPQIILALMMVVAVINMISALLIIILERSQMIGLLKALGLQNAGLRRVFLYHAAYLVGLGLLIGNAFALSLYFLQKTTRFITLDAATYFVSYVPVEISVIEVLILNVGMMVIALLVLLVPSFLIARINPIKSIQFR